jgi:DNA-binding protein YbaB
VTQPDPTTRAFSELSRIAQRARQRLEEAAEVRERFAELAGHASAADGLVRVTSTPGDPVHELHLEPRALRLTSVDLAAAVQAAVRDAKRDLESQLKKATAGLVDPQDDPIGLVGDPDAARVKLAQLGELATGSAAQVTALFEQFTRQARR